MIELECELIFLQRYNLNQHKSTINHILTKKTSIETNARPSQKVRLISTIVEILFVFQFQL